MLRLLHIVGDRVVVLDPGALADGIPDGGYLWLDMEGPTPDEAECLHDPALDIDPMII